MNKSPWTWVVVCWTSFLEGEDSKAAFVMQRETMAMASVCSRRKPLQDYFLHTYVEMQQFTLP